MSLKPAPPVGPGTSPATGFALEELEASSCPCRTDAGGVWSAANYPPLSPGTRTPRQSAEDSEGTMAVEAEGLALKLHLSGVPSRSRVDFAEMGGAHFREAWSSTSPEGKRARPWRVDGVMLILFKPLLPARLTSLCGHARFVMTLFPLRRLFRVPSDSGSNPVCGEPDRSGRMQLPTVLSVDGSRHITIYPYVEQDPVRIEAGGLWFERERPLGGGGRVEEAKALPRLFRALGSTQSRYHAPHSRPTRR